MKHQICNNKHIIELSPEDERVLDDVGFAMQHWPRHTTRPKLGEYTSVLVMQGDAVGEPAAAQFGTDIEVMLPGNAQLPITIGNITLQAAEIQPYTKAA